MNMEISELNKLYLFQLENVQKIITRLSNIGYILLTTLSTLFGIYLAIVFNVEINQMVRLISSIILFLFVIGFFLGHLINLRNEQAFRKIFNEKLCNLNLNEEIKKDNPMDFLKCLKSFSSERKKVKWKKVFLSWTNIIWTLLFLSSIGTILLFLFT